MALLHRGLVTPWPYYTVDMLHCGQLDMLHLGLVRPWPWVKAGSLQILNRPLKSMVRTWTFPFDSLYHQDLHMFFSLVRPWTLVKAGEFRSVETTEAVQ